MSHLCPHCNSLPLEDYVWWSLEKKGVTVGGVRSVEKSTAGSTQTGSWWCKQVKVSCQGLERAFSTSGPLREFDQCVEVAGETTSGWRRPRTQQCDEPL